MDILKTPMIDYYATNSPSYFQCGYLFILINVFKNSALLFAQKKVELITVTFETFALKWVEETMPGFLA